MNSRGLGWREDMLPGMKAKKISFAPGLRIGSSQSASFRQYRTRRMYQAGFGACVAFAIARAIHIGLQIDGANVPPMPSPWHLYAIGLAQEYAGRDPDTTPDLLDRGSYPSLVLEATRKLGFVPWDLAPYGPKGSTFEEHSATLAAQAPLQPYVSKPSLTALRNGIDQSGLQWYDASYAKGAARLELIASAMNAERPIPFVIGMDVDHAFLNHRGSEPIRSIDSNKIAGGHMVMILAMFPNGNALIDNWWEDWGGVDSANDGLGILHADLLGSMHVRNVYGILSQPCFA